MSGSISSLLQNRILLTGLCGWASAQIIKTILYLAVNRTFEPERLFGDGGMPSAHSATVTSVALSAGFECGFESAVFAVACILAIIVMHDAMGVRLETGKQAKVINDMMALFEHVSEENLPFEEQLKELVGHTPLQVFAGCALGVVVAVLMHL